VAQNQQVMARALARHGAVLAVEDFDPSEHQAMVGLIKAHVLDLEEHPHRLGETRQMLETLVPDQANALQDVLDLMI
jgi:hypothetical protein